MAYVSNNLLGDGLVDQIVEAGAADGLQHLSHIVLSGTDVSVNVLQVRRFHARTTSKQGAKGRAVAIRRAVMAILADLRKVCLRRLCI